MFTSLTFLQVR